MHVRGTFYAATFAVLAGCGHGEAFQAPDPHAAGPLVPGSVVRLTYSAGRDQSGAWSSRGIVYTFEDVTSPIRGWCLGVLPDSGGSRTRTWCAAVPDSQIAFDWASEGPGGLAYLRAAGVPFAMTPVTWSVMVSPDGDPSHGAAISPVVVTVPGAPALQGAEQLRWLDSTRLVWIGARRAVGSPCRGCPVDTVSTGRALLTQDVRSPGVPQVLANTDFATSVAVYGGDEVFFTRGGDRRVYRRVMITGQTTVLLDFGPGNIVRDVQVAGGRLVAVLGGLVSFGFDPAFADTLQVDEGGDLVVADLATGALSVVALPFPVRHPALSRDGRRVVVQSAAMPEDLYLVELP